MSAELKPWEAAVWDRPKNGTRYYVCRGEEAAGTANGGVYTFASRDAAKQYAEQLNRRAGGDTP